MSVQRYFISILLAIRQNWLLTRHRIMLIQASVLLLFVIPICFPYQKAVRAVPILLHSLSSTVQLPQHHQKPKVSLPPANVQYPSRTTIQTVVHAVATVNMSISDKLKLSLLVVHLPSSPLRPPNYTPIISTSCRSSLFLFNANG